MNHCSRDWKNCTDGHCPPQPYSFQVERDRLLLIIHWPKVLTDMAFPSSYSHLYYVQLCQVVIHVQEVRKWEPNLEYV